MPPVSRSHAAGGRLDHLLVLDIERFGLEQVDLDPAGRLLVLERFGPAGHGPRVPLPDAPAGGEDERVFGVRDFCGGLVFDGEELAEPVGLTAFLHIWTRRSVLVWVPSFSA
jgi:hypothetical protein